VDYIRPKREVRHALVISDPQPVDSVRNVWAAAGQAASIGIFSSVRRLPLYRPGHPAAGSRRRRYRDHAGAARQGGQTLRHFAMADGAGDSRIRPRRAQPVGDRTGGPVSQWIGRAPEIGATIQQKLSVLDQPLAALQELEGSAVRWQ